MFGRSLVRIEYTVQTARCSLFPSGPRFSRAHMLSFFWYLWCVFGCVPPCIFLFCGAPCLFWGFKTAVPRFYLGAKRRFLRRGAVDSIRCRAETTTCSVVETAGIACLARLGIKACTQPTYSFILTCTCHSVPSRSIPSHTVRRAPNMPFERVIVVQHGIVSNMAIVSNMQPPREPSSHQSAGVRLRCLAAQAAASVLSKAGNPEGGPIGAPKVSA